MNKRKKEEDKEEKEEEEKEKEEKEEEEEQEKEEKEEEEEQEKEEVEILNDVKNFLLIVNFFLKIENDQRILERILHETFSSTWNRDYIVNTMIKRYQKDCHYSFPAFIGYFDSTNKIIFVKNLIKEIKKHL